jgi:hypothetical protein
VRTPKTPIWNDSPRCGDRWPRPARPLGVGGRFLSDLLEKKFNSHHPSLLHPDSCQMNESLVCVIMHGLIKNERTSVLRRIKCLIKCHRRGCLIVYFWGGDQVQDCCCERDGFLPGRLLESRRFLREDGWAQAPSLRCALNDSARSDAFFGAVSNKT